MNPVIKAIMKRRSVRSYEAKPVPREIVKTIIEAGNEAPSAMNSQPWRFVVFEDTAARRKLLETARPGAKRLFDTLKGANPERYNMIMKQFQELEDPIYYSAPAVIFVIGSGRFASHSCPLACENMMLAAYSLSLGSCWVGLGSMVADDPEMQKILELKEGETVFGPILIGYQKDSPERPEKKPPQIKWI